MQHACIITDSRGGIRQCGTPMMRAPIANCSALHGRGVMRPSPGMGVLWAGACMGGADARDMRPRSSARASAEKAMHRSSHCVRSLRSHGQCSGARTPSNLPCCAHDTCRLSAQVPRARPAHCRAQTRARAIAPRTSADGCVCACAGAWRQGRLLGMRCCRGGRAMNQALANQSALCCERQACSVGRAGMRAAWWCLAPGSHCSSQYKA